MCADAKPVCGSSEKAGTVLKSLQDPKGNSTSSPRLWLLQVEPVGKCVCRSGYGADDCSEQVCPDMCSGQGECNRMARTCTCFDGFEGLSCNITKQPPCPGDCKGHGKCAGGRCFCYHSWTGEDCSKWMPPSCPSDRNGHGSCEEGVCECDKHYSGQACQIFTEPHYASWPWIALVIPVCIIVGFILWVVWVLKKVDSYDGRSDLAEHPLFRYFLGRKKVGSKVVEGTMPNSRVKKQTETFV